MTTESTKLHSVASWQFCPLCGEELEHEEVPVGGIPGPKGFRTTKTNLEVSCPEHGVLYI